MDRIAPLPRTPLLLGLAGWLPFWIPVVLTVQAAMTGRSATAEAALFIVYGAIILGFLGGVRWGRALASPLAGPAIYVQAILPSLAGLAAVGANWAGAPMAGFGLVLISLAAHWRWDAGAARRGVLPAWYGQLRSVLSLGAGAAALAMLAMYPLTG